jgi:hypothetical protein
LETIKIYRAISEEELDDLLKTGCFNCIQGHYELKLFTDNLHDASTFCRKFNDFDEKYYHVVEVDVPIEFTKKFNYEEMDVGLVKNPSIIVDNYILDEFNSIISFTILDYVEIG